MPNNTVYQVTSLLSGASIMVLMEHDSESTAELEIHFGDKVEGKVTHTIDPTLQAHFDAVKDTPTANLAVFHSTLVTIDDGVVTLQVTEPTEDDRATREQSSAGNAPLMETY